MIRATLLLAMGATALGQSTDVDRNGCVDLADYAEVQRAFTGPACVDAPAGVEMVTVPGGGAGPAYTFEISKYEITNEQFVAFLNDAIRDGGTTERGAFLRFDGNGRVRLLDYTLIFSIGTYGAANRIEFESAAPGGARFEVVDGFEQHPVVGVNWYGAIKYANWLTLAAGHGTNERCYAEGVEYADFYPIVSTKAGWAGGDLTDAERSALVDACRGFRLPMDNLGRAISYPALQPNPFNEWYKAAAYDPDGPASERRGIHGELVAARHWFFGYGRDTMAPGDANYGENDDPFEPGTTPVGWFNGANWLKWNVQRTNRNRNRWGAFDFSGNAGEWVQDKVNWQHMRAVRGGNWFEGAGSLTCSLRDEYSATEIDRRIGFRVVHVP